MMKQSQTFVFPTWKRLMGVAVILLSLLSITFFAYTKFEATRGAHAANSVGFYVTNSDPNAVSFEVHNNTLDTSSCIPGVGLTDKQFPLGSFDPANAYTVNGWTSGIDCTGTKRAGPQFRTGTKTECVVVFAPASVTSSCNAVGFYVTNSDPNAVSFEVHNNTLNTSSCVPGVGLTDKFADKQFPLGSFNPANEYTVIGWSSTIDCTGMKRAGPAFTPITDNLNCTVSFIPTDVSSKCV
jgi:hypothetical protein